MMMLLDILLPLIIFYVLRKGLIIHCPRAYYIIQAGVEFVPILLINPAEFRDDRHEPPHLGHVTY